MHKPSVASADLSILGRRERPAGRSPECARLPQAVTPLLGFPAQLYFRLTSVRLKAEILPARILPQAAVLVSLGTPSQPQWQSWP